LKEKVDMVLAKGRTLDAGKWNNTDLKVMLHWCKREGDKAMPKNKDGLLLRCQETCTLVVAAFTYREEEEGGISAGNGDAASCVAVEPVGDVGYAIAASTVDHVGGATAAAVGAGVDTVNVPTTGVRWSLTRPRAADVARPPADSYGLSAARAPNPTQGKLNFAAAADDIPDAAHTSTHDQSKITSVAALPDTATAAAAITTKIATVTANTAAFSIHNHEDGANDDWDLAPLGPRALGNVAASGDGGHHVAHCGLQVFDLLLSNSESEDEICASKFDDCDEF
jgi:hypothetical protein